MTNENTTEEVSALSQLLTEYKGETNPTNSELTIKDDKNKITTVKMYERLPENYLKDAVNLAKGIDTSNPTVISRFGYDAQKQMTDFSERVLGGVTSQDLGEIGESLNDLMVQLQDADVKDLVADRSIFKRIFGKVKKNIYEATNRYQSIGTKVDLVAQKLTSDREGLLSDVDQMDELFERNKNYFDALNIYIAAGQLKLDELRTETIPKLQEAAKESGTQMEVQQVKDIIDFSDRLDKRVHNLEIAREITMQQASQIRLIQNTNLALSQKIDDSINTAIPLWKNQVVIALTLLRQQDAVAAQRAVSETTNDLLKKNAEMLKISAIETAKENERGIVDIETLEQTQNDLVTTLQETLKIRNEGRERRKAGEVRLMELENKMRTQLLELNEQE